MLVESGTEDDLRARLRQTICYLQAAGARHLDIEQNQVWPQVRCLLHCFFAISCLTDDLNIRNCREQLPQPFPRKFLIIYQQHTNHGAAPTVCTARGISTATTVISGATSRSKLRWAASPK